jgi:hypothetical protein
MDLGAQVGCQTGLVERLRTEVKAREYVVEAQL